jgi:hypothetical protein
MEFSEAQLHEVRVSGPSLIKQAVQNISDPLDMVREALSNCCAQEVGAKKVILTIFKHPDYGATFSFFDDGVGMDYTPGSEGPDQGRLNRFLNLGFSGVIGVPPDEFGWKGLGAKLMYWCKQLEIETVSAKDRKRYKVFVQDPMGALEKTNPLLPEPMVSGFPVPRDHPPFTKITVYGYDGGRWTSDYELEDLKIYLFHRTIIGCTREDRTERLPVIVLKHPDGEEVLKPGYRFVQRRPQSWRTVVIDPITVTTPTDDNREKVEVTLRGGFTLDTGSTGTEYSLTPGHLNTGINVSVLGIPYFSVDFNGFRGEFRPGYKLCNFVAECDLLNLNMERSWYAADSRSRAFESGLKKAIARIRDLDAYKQWVENEEKLRREELSDSLNERKQKLQDPEQKWVFIDGQLTHVEPANEKDTLAILWKLEGMQKLPFTYFRSLQHTSLEGIDLICEYQETKESQKRLFESVEVEFKLQSYLDHEHVPGQTGLIFCWAFKTTPGANLKKVTDYRFNWEIGGSIVPVYVISRFPGVEVRPKVKTATASSAPGS